MSVSSSVVGTQLIVTCPEKFNSEAAALVAKEVGAHAASVAGVALDFKLTKQFETLTLLRCIGAVGKYLRSNNRTFFAMNASPELATEIRMNGLDTTIKFATERRTPPKPGLNVEFVNPIIESTIKTIGTQCATVLRIEEKPFLKGTRNLPAIEIAGIIGLVSTGFTGTISLCFPKETFLNIMEGMLGERQPEITDDLQDGAGELLNIIFGQSKVILNEKGFGIEKAIPTVVRATDLKVSQYSSSPALILLFASDRGGFYVEFALEA